MSLLLEPGGMQQWRAYDRDRVTGELRGEFMLVITPVDGKYLRFEIRSNFGTQSADVAMVQWESLFGADLQRTLAASEAQYRSNALAEYERQAANMRRLEAIKSPAGIILEPGQGIAIPNEEAGATLSNGGDQPLIVNVGERGLAAARSFSKGTNAR